MCSLCEGWQTNLNNLLQVVPLRLGVDGWIQIEEMLKKRIGLKEDKKLQFVDHKYATLHPRSRIHFGATIIHVVALLSFKFVLRHLRLN